MTAVISPCGLYRYRLERDWRAGQANDRLVGWIMVNPSTADARQDDHTIRKCIGFTERMGAHRLAVANLFAYRSTDVRRLTETADPVGPENDRHLVDLINDSDVVVVAWGPLAKQPWLLRSHFKSVVRIADEVGRELMCFGTAKDGHPRHPLMLAYDTPLVPWERPR